MESLFQNCVSEFDLNLFEQTNANRATSAEQCPVSRKLGIARLKERLKNVSQVVHKAQKNNEILLDVQKKLLDAKQELEETRNLLFEKNEEHKVICDERSVYFNQASEYCNEIQNLKERLKSLEEISFEVQMKDKVISGYSEQVKGLQTELDNLAENKKQVERDAAAALKQAKSYTAIVKKQLSRLLKQYVVPTTAKPDKWLAQIMKRYISEAHKEDESEKIDKLDEATETQDLDEEDPLPQAVSQCNISADFDLVGSVDTGRGSSLTFSDSDKSFHSPEYYMDDIPCTVTNVCNKCNVPKSDGSTSPLPQETPEDAVSSTINVICKKCVLLSTKDASTSPIRPQKHDTATDTADIFFEVASRNAVAITHSDKNQSDDNGDSRKNTCVIASDENNVSVVSKTEKLQDFTFDTDDEDDDIVNRNCRTPSPVGESYAPSPANFDKIQRQDSVKSIPNEKEPTIMLQNNERLNDISNKNIDNSNTQKQVGVEHSNSEAVSVVKIHIEAASDSDDDEVMHNVSRIASPVEEYSRSSPLVFNEGTSNSLNVPSNNSLIPPLNLCNRPPDLKTVRVTQQKTEYLESNNDNNCSKDVEYDSTIRNIFDEMRLTYRMISPIPGTPPPSEPSLRSPVASNVHERRVQNLLNAYNKRNDLIMTKLKELLQFCSQDIPQDGLLGLFNNDNQNEELYGDSMINCNIRNKQIAKTVRSVNGCKSSHNNIPPDLVDLNSESMLSIIEVNENEDLNHEAHVYMDKDLHTGLVWTDEVTTRDTNGLQYETVCDINRDLSQVVRNNKMTSAPLYKAKSEYVSHVNDVCSNISGICSSTHPLPDIVSENTEDTQATVVYANAETMPSTIDSRNNIVYEGEDTCDNYVMQRVDLTQNENGTAEKVLVKRKRKAKKITKLDRFRFKMTPKNKIKRDFKKKVKKQLSIPTSIITTLPKKRVTASDSAATLNDRSVYENAVKVLAAQKIAKEPKIVIKDCVRYPPNKNKGNGKKDDTNNNLKIYEDSKKRKLSEKATDAPENCSFDANHSSTSFEQSPVKATTEITQKPLTNKLKLDKINHDKAPKNVIHNTSCVKSLENIKLESETCKVTGVSKSVDLSDAKKVKRKKTGVSVSDGQNQNQNNNCDGDIIEPVSRRILRSFSHANLNKELGSKEITIATECRAGLVTKVVRSQLKKQDSPIKSPVGRKDKSCRLNTSLQIDSESTQIVSLNSAVSETSSHIKHKNIRSDKMPTVLYREGLRSKADQSQQETTPITSPAEKRRRISRVNKHAQQDLCSMQDVPPNNPNVTETPSHNKLNKENGSEKTPTGSRHLEGSLLHSFDTGQNWSEKQESAQITPTAGRKHRISRVNTCTQRVSESRQVVSHESPVPDASQKNDERIVSYADLDLSSYQDNETQHTMMPRDDEPAIDGRKDSLLCRTIEKYGVKKKKFACTQVPEDKIKRICNQLETKIGEIVELANEDRRSAMLKLVADIRTWEVKHFLLGIIKYLRHPERKIELFSKSNCPPAPPMTKREQVLLFVLDELQKAYEYRNIVQKILTNIEYALFALNKPAAEYDVIEAMSHFYALLCRTFQKVYQLRMFMVDAMYCLQLKSVILIQQCLELHIFALPLGHMRLAKSPLVICLVYLLHFYKCADRHSSRVQDIRNTLKNKYNYDMTQWTESKILDLFRTSILEIRDNPMEMKLLRVSLLTLAKRSGVVWCHNNIVKNMLQPLISDKNTPDVARRFAVSLLGPLLKPYPADMKVHCETIINYLMDMLKNNNSKMQEAIISSLICIDKNNSQIYRYLSNWTPKHVSPEFQLVFRNYVRSKPLNTWKNILSGKFNKY